MELGGGVYCIMGQREKPLHFGGDPSHRAAGGIRTVGLWQKFALVDGEIQQTGLKFNRNKV